MKQLTIVRHAKSSWSSGADSDFDRPLNKRGERAAPRMARHLADVVGLRPDHIVSSSALRALTTARVFAPVLGIDADEVIESQAIYGGALQELVYTVKEFPEASSSAMLFGHFPGVQELAHYLAGKNCIGHYPTCGVAMMRLDVKNWPDIDQGCGTLIEFLYPKMFDT